MPIHPLSARSSRTIAALASLLALFACEVGGEDTSDESPVDEAPRDASRPAQVIDSGSARPDARVEAGQPAADAASGAARDAGQAAPPADAASPDDGYDDVLGTRVARAESFWAGAGNVHYGDRELRLYGLNWFGLETEARALFGVPETQRSVADFLAQIESLGFNALRVPLSPESIDPGFPSPDWAKRGDIDTGREQFEELARAAKDAGIYMLWDIHTCASAVGFRKTGPTDPACTGYSKEKWLENLRTLATLAEAYAPYVVGIDLFNEPYGLTWEAWKALAEEAGRAVLSENPRILTFVEGVGPEGYQGADPVFWGENLTGVRQAPIDLPASRLVYSPHVYGPSVFEQPYFAASGFPDNMPAIWDDHFGFLFAGDAPLILGEFGGRYTDADKVWQDALVDYLLEKSNSHSFFYWSLNPNSGDTGGLLQDDWRTVNMDKLNLLKRLQQ